MLAFAFFGEVVHSIYINRQFSSNSAVANLEKAGATREPNTWTKNDIGRETGDIYLRIRYSDGTTTEKTLSLPKSAIGMILNEQTVLIRHLKDDPAQFIMTGDPFPSIEYGKIAYGVLMIVLFLFSLKSSDE